MWEFDRPWPKMAEIVEKRTWHGSKIIWQSEKAAVEKRPLHGWKNDIIPVIRLLRRILKGCRQYKSARRSGRKTEQAEIE